MPAAAIDEDGQAWRSSGELRKFDLKGEARAGEARRPGRVRVRQGLPGQNPGEGQWCECSQFGAQYQGDADYLEGCRQKRNTVEYDYAGGATRRMPRN